MAGDSETNNKFIERREHPRTVVKIEIEPKLSDIFSTPKNGIRKLLNNAGLAFPSHCFRSG